MTRDKFTSDKISGLVRFPSKWHHVLSLKLKQFGSETGPANKLLWSCLTQAYEFRKILFKKRLFSDPQLVSEWRLLQAQHRRTLTNNFKKLPEHKFYLSQSIFNNVGLNDFDHPVELFDLSKITTFEPGCIYLLNSNEVTKAGLQNYINTYLKSPEAIVAIWDFDNHHNLAPSFAMAAFCDLYIPCHEQNLGQMAHLNDSIAAPVSAAVIQWSRPFLTDNLTKILTAPRHTQPLGRHLIYKGFWTRNSNVEKLSKWFDHVGPIGDHYHQLNHEDRLHEWTSHMAHWVLPTFNDVPIRIFDALITGGIPLAPLSLRQHPSLSSFKEHILFYDEADLADPWPITHAANERFLSQGTDGILQRHRLAMEQGHVDARVAQMINLIQDHFDSTHRN